MLGTKNRLDLLTQLLKFEPKEKRVNPPSLLFFKKVTFKKKKKPFWFFFFLNLKVECFLLMERGLQSFFFITLFNGTQSLEHSYDSDYIWINLKIVSKILTQNRSCLMSKNVETLSCTKSWLNGFEDNLFLLWNIGHNSKILILLLTPFHYILKFY